MALYKGEDKLKDIHLGDVPIFKVYAGEEFCGFFTFSHENLVENSDLLIDSDSDGVPDGFTLRYATDISLTNGIAKFTATAKYGAISPSSRANFNSSDTFYSYANFKSDSNLVQIPTPIGANARHSGSGDFEFHSTIGVYSNLYLIGQIYDDRSTDWTPIEVDSIGAINITDLVSRGILPSGLTDAQYKTILDNYFNS